MICLICGEPPHPIGDCPLCQSPETTTLLLRRARRALLRIQDTLRDGNSAISDTVWLAPGETMLDAVDFALKIEP